MRARKCYFICFTVRSGSTLLGQLLTDTRLAGAPKERFYHNIRPEQPTGDSIADYGTYLARALAADSTANGVFGSRIGGGYWKDFLRRLQALPELADLPAAAALARVFPDLRYLHVSRRNKVRQAVSHWLAIQSGRWTSADPAAAGEAVYNFQAIDSLLQELIFREAVWAEYFAQNGIRPFPIIYEDFVAAPAAALVDILDFLEIERPADFRPPRPRLAKVGGARAEAWTQRFRQEKQAGFWTEFW